jgi:alkylhydroperoxidase family enzyme
MQHHIASSKRIGLGPSEWSALRDPAAGPFSEKEKLALAFAEKLTRMPTNNAAREAEALKGRFSEPEIVDLTALVALVNLTNRLTDGLGVDLEISKEKVA